MDVSSCVILYLDRRAGATAELNSQTLSSIHIGDDHAAQNIRTIVSAFGHVHVCKDGISCLAKLTQLDARQSTTPLLVLFDMPPDDEEYRPWDKRSSSPTTSRSSRSPGAPRREPSDVYGMHFLQILASEIRQRSRSRLVIPVAVLRTRFDFVDNPVHMSKYLDAGAVDVLTTPLSNERVQGLSTHAYRRHKEAVQEESSFVLEKRNRKLSWVGIDEERPYAYLREVMVSGLLSGICNPETVGATFDHREFKVAASRMRAVESAVGTWSFSAHEFDADELLYAALVILQHALQIPELEQWRMSTDDLTTFLMACRKAYNDFVLYHNFRHVVDVLQAVFYFLLRIGILPPYPHGGSPTPVHDGAVFALLQPFDALTLLISAIGHDVGHPGVNNAFLVALNAPLAQLYNDRSVLEAFHCAAYSQILRRYWPQAFADAGMRKLMINSILATDMGLHFKYLIDMGNLQDRLASCDDNIDGWTCKAQEETRDLCCGLLIKCADISNVARKYDIAAQWAAILTDEFSNQGAMEKELDLPTCLFGGPPDRDDVIKMAESQIGFMNIFAGPLFEGMTNILPAMAFGIKEMSANKLVWERKIEVESSKRNAEMHYESGDGIDPSIESMDVLDSDDEEAVQEEEGLPPLPVDRDAMMNPSRISHIGEERLASSSVVNTRAMSEPVSPAAQRLRHSSTGSYSSMTSHRKTSNTGSFQAPHSSPYHRHSRSRRSSKDAALEQLEYLQLHGIPRVDNRSFDGSRRGSADASLTTILVRSQTPQSQHRASASLTGSPSRRNPRSASQPGHKRTHSSLPSSRGNTATNTIITTTGPRSPSINGSTLHGTDACDKDDEYGSATGSNTYLRPDAVSMDQRHTFSAPDILAIPMTTEPGKPNVISQISSGHQGDDHDDSHHGGHNRLRQSRSRNRLKGLRFWRKRWKSPGGGGEMERESNE